MIKSKLKIFLTIFSLLLLTACSQPEKKSLDIVFQYKTDIDYWEMYDFSNTLIPTKEIYEETIREQIAAIEKEYNLTDWWSYVNPEAEALYLNLQIYDTDTFSMSHPYKVTSKDIEATLTIPTIAMEDGNPIANRLVHELIHLIFGCYNVSIEEGFANYTSALLYSDYTSYQDAQIAKKKHINLMIEEANLSDEEIAYVTNVVGDGTITYGYFPNMTLLALFNYQYSQSFVTYLIDMYGTEKFVEFAISATSNDDYETYFGKNLDTLRNEWLIYFEQIEVPDVN